MGDDKISYEEILMDFLMIDDGSGMRVSKAKLIGLIVLVLYVVMGINGARGALPYFLVFAIFVLISYLIGLFYYAIIRGAGYILRNYVL